MNAGRDRGTIAIEMAILTPAVIAFFATALIAGRYAIAKQAADSAAFDAARTASLSRTAATAQSRAREAALRSFTAQGVTCRQLTVSVDTSEFGNDVGEPAVVRVTVVCLAEMSDLIVPDLAFPGTDGTIRLESDFVSPLDTYRTRS